MATATAGDATLGALATVFFATTGSGCDTRLTGFFAGGAGFDDFATGVGLGKAFFAAAGTGALRTAADDGDFALDLTALRAGGLEILEGMRVR